MSRRESDFEWAERQRGDVENMQPERSIEFREAPITDGQVEFYRRGWIEATNHVSEANRLASLVLRMEWLETHPHSHQSHCIYCEAIRIAVTMVRRKNGRD